MLFCSFLTDETKLEIAEETFELTLPWYTAVFPPSSSLKVFEFVRDDVDSISGVSSWSLYMSPVDDSDRCLTMILPLPFSALLCSSKFKLNKLQDFYLGYMYGLCLMQEKTLQSASNDALLIIAVSVQVSFWINKNC